MSVEDTIRQANDIVRNAEVCYMSELRQDYSQALAEKRPQEAKELLQLIIEENDRLHAKKPR
jgi:tartrate dehydratase alpha subunit/fumarate hydratase class I-like protein